MMEQFYRVPLRQLVEEFNLKVIYQAPDYEQIQITAVDINRAGMQLTGFLSTLSQCACRPSALWRTPICRR